MKTNTLTRLLLISFLPLLILVSMLFAMTQSVEAAANGEFNPTTIPKIASVMRVDDSLSNRLGLIPAQQITQTTWPAYGPATILLEDQGGTVSELSPAYVNGGFATSYILQEGNSYYLWLGSVQKSGSAFDSIEQRFESQDGLIWHNRTNTNLSQSDPFWRNLAGIRHVIKDGPLYEGWELYFYSVISGWWAVNTRYITSTNGLTWTVVNQAPVGTMHYPSLIKEGSIYHIWGNPNVDDRFDPDNNLRYRTSVNGGNGWGHWKTGGAVINIDSNPLGLIPTRVRQGPGNTYQLFYRTGTGINLAISTDGINFTTQITDLIDFSEVFSVPVIPGDFLVTNIGGEDWFYFTYIDTQGFSRMAVSRPAYPDLSIRKTVTPAIVSPSYPLTYTLTFSNAGDGTATGIIITDIIPSLLTNLSINSNVTLTDTGHTPGYMWQVQDLAPGAEGIITITGQISPNLSSDTIFTNTVIITNSIPDSDPANNQAEASVEVVVPVLSMSKKVTPDTNVAYRGTVTYTLVLSNSSNVDISNIFVTDTLPISITFVGWVEQAGAGENNDQITWNGNLSAGQSITFTFVANHTGNYGDRITNIGEYSYLNGSGNAQATFMVETAPAITLSISDTTLMEGDSGQTKADFEVMLSSASIKTVTVNYVTANGTATNNDYVAASGMISFTPGSLKQIITVMVNGDTEAEADETFYVNLTGVTSSAMQGMQVTAANVTLLDGQGQGLIIDDDVIIAPPSSKDNDDDDDNYLPLPDVTPVSTASPLPVRYLPETGSYRAVLLLPWIIIVLFTVSIIAWGVYRYQR